MPEPGPDVLTPDDAGGTAPGDRRFRPDVEGLRAVAIVLVVLFHARVPHVGGGYVGVDAFFVISGFVITGVLLRRQAADGRTSALAFYARRFRRILPASTLVIVATVVAAYVVDGRALGSMTADDGSWAAVFLANVHFAAQAGPGAALRPLSPLGTFWSLSVEEQFYLVFPAVFIAAFTWAATRRPRSVLAGVLVVSSLASFTLCVLQTHQLAGTAYFSPFTRAWEFSVGALVALGTPWFGRLGSRGAAALTWAGLLVVIGSALAFTPATVYPGALAAVPVLGAAAVIAGGCADPRAGCERLLGTASVLWVGRRSYSWYLWHWPVLIVYAEQGGNPPFSLGVRLLLMAAALGLAAATYTWVEDPARKIRSRAGVTVVAGLVGSVVLAGVLTVVSEAVR